MWGIHINAVFSLSMGAKTLKYQRVTNAATRCPLCANPS